MKKNGFTLIELLAVIAIIGIISIIAIPNIVGLSTQVPTKYVFVSSGPYNEYEVKNTDFTA